MPQHVLIVEDDDSIATIVSDLCKELGLEVTIAKNGKDALARFDSLAPALVVLDVLLPGGMDGLKVAETIRSRSMGQQTRIAVITGFLKDPKVQRETQQRLSLKAILPKPFRADELRQIIASSLGLAVAAAEPVAQAPAPSTGSAIDSFEEALSRRSALTLFSDLYRGRAEGVLEITRGQAKKRFYLQRGFFRYAHSNVKAESLAGMIPASRGVPEAKIAEALALAKAEGITIPQAMVERRIISQKELPALLAAQTEEVAITTAQWTEGEVRFKAGEADPGLDGRANPILCAVKAVKRYYAPDAAKVRLGTFANAVVDRTPELDRELFALKSLFPGETLTPHLNGRLTLREIQAKVRDSELTMLYAVLVSGLARVRGTAAAAPVRSPERPAAAPAPAPKVQLTPEEEASQEMIASEANRQKGCRTLYDVLSIDSKADAATAKNVYLRLARQFHADVFAGQNLGDMAPILDDIFKKIREANDTITNPAKRDEYDTYLDRKARGLPTDVGKIFEAESTFGRALALEKAGRLREAEKLYRDVVALNNSEPNFLTTLARAAYALQGPPGKREVLELLDKALALGQDYLPAMLLKAQVLLDSGERDGALDLLRKIVGINPQFENAMALLRHAKQTDKSDAGKGGLFGKLFGGKGK